MAKSKTEFYAEVLVTSMIRVPLKATSFEGAVTEAHALKRDQVIAPDPDLIEGDLVVSGVHRESAWGKVYLR